MNFKIENKYLDITNYPSVARYLEVMASKDFLIPFLLFISWVNIGRMTSGVYPMKDGLNQIVIPLLPIALVLTIPQLIHTKKFLKRNRENIELGKDLEYSNSKYYMIRIMFPVFYLVIAAFVFYILYVSIVFKNKIVLFALLPLTGVVVGQLYRIFVKPSKHSKRFKIIAFGITMLAVVMISSVVGIMGILNIGGLGNGSNDLDREKYRVLLTSDFIALTEGAERTLLENTSLLVPRSYEHTSRGFYTDEIRYLETEYSKALTEGIDYQ